LLLELVLALAPVLTREEEREGEEGEKEIQPPPVMSMDKIEVYWSFSSCEEE